MSYMCSDCTMSVREDPCREYRKCNDGSGCVNCNHLPECHAESFDEGERESLAAVALHLAGGDVGFTKAAEGFNVVADALALRCGSFSWGEHLINGPEGARSECQHCGATFADVLLQFECSALD